MVIAVDDDDFALLKQREVVYDPVDVSDRVHPRVGKVFVFIAPDEHHPNIPILQTYIETCARHLAACERRAWLADTIIENPILNDRHNPAYMNAA